MFGVSIAPQAKKAGTGRNCPLWSHSSYASGIKPFTLSENHLSLHSGQLNNLTTSTRACFAGSPRRAKKDRHRGLKDKVKSLAQHGLHSGADDLVSGFPNSFSSKSLNASKVLP